LESEMGKNVLVHLLASFSVSIIQFHEYVITRHNELYQNYTLT